jgi:hypothetical protein
LTALTLGEHFKEKQMASVFDEQQIGHALEKFADFIKDSGSGAEIPGWADTASKVIIDSLRAFEEKLQAHHVPPDEREYHLGPAVYAICELQAFVRGDKSDVANRMAARVYRDFLTARIEELRKMEQDLDG